MCLELADDGIGIAKENKQKVFDRFYRVDSSRTKAEGGVGGTGLGLSVARWIAEQHGIRIAMESELGKGRNLPRGCAFFPCFYFTSSRLFLSMINGVQR